MKRINSSLLSLLVLAVFYQVIQNDLMALAFQVDLYDNICSLSPSCI